MSGFFNLENGFFTTLSKIADIILLSVVWSLLCIPIITIGPATTALYYSTVKAIRRDRGYLFKEFFKSFKQNFKRGTIAGVIMTLITLFLGFDLFWAWMNMSAIENSSILLGIFIALSVMFACFSIYVFPILSRFDMTIKQLFKAAMFMAIKHLPSTVVMFAIIAICAIGIFFIPILIFIIPAGAAFIISLLMERILKKYMPESQGSGEETGVDEWYLE
ncbi:MAG TPA: YesL family protein [Clostridiales bacterium]|nr:YesL family protein [Clostridiales bacterium]